jgi:hypothetical protein
VSFRGSQNDDVTKTEKNRMSGLGYPFETAALVNNI